MVVLFKTHEHRATSPEALSEIPLMNFQERRWTTLKVYEVSEDSFCSVRMDGCGNYQKGGFMPQNRTYFPTSRHNQEIRTSQCMCIEIEHET